MLKNQFIYIPKFILVEFEVFFKKKFIFILDKINTIMKKFNYKKDILKIIYRYFQENKRFFKFLI